MLKGNNLKFYICLLKLNYFQTHFYQATAFTNLISKHDFYMHKFDKSPAAAVLQ